MTDRPILLLDIDGCCNPVGLGHPDGTPFQPPKTWQFEPRFISDEPSGEFPLNLSKEMGQTILALDVDIRWLTTWTVNAHNNIGKHFGWPKFPVAGRPQGPRDFEWKPRAVKNLLAEDGPPVVWIDDDIPDFMRLLNCGENDPFNRLITVAPKTHRGLTRWHIKWIKLMLERKAK